MFQLSQEETRPSRSQIATLNDGRVKAAGTGARELFVGLDLETPLLGGGRRPYINLDNAATTPPFRAVMEYVGRCARWYSSVHRGTGFKSLLSTRVYDRCRDKVAAFLGADPSYHVVVFCGNTTDAINRLCCRFPLAEGEVVLTTVMEHHSNLLPWRFQGQAKVDYARAKWPCGALDLDDLEMKLRQHRGNVRLVAVTGASNITGLVPPLKLIARMAHQYGAMLLVDASQLIAHRRIEMGRAGDPERIDFLAFSSHKMYAPFGSGGLIGPREFFERGRPGLLGGGAVDLVTLDEVEWTEAPEREEAGTPNLLGICATVKAMEIIETLGMDAIVAHERELTAKTIDRLPRIEGIRIFGGCDLINGKERVGVVPFLSDKYDHALLAAILGYEWGIGVRNGCFCAHPYIEHLLQIGDEELRRFLDSVRQGEHAGLPGFVRVSLGLYNTEEEIEYLAEALESIQKSGPKGRYLLNKKTGEYTPEDFSFDFDSFLR